LATSAGIPTGRLNEITIEEEAAEATGEMG
jgi:hypothetical protein